MEKIADSVGIGDFTFHAMRHTFATRMLEVGVPAKVVQEILGHADVTLTLNTYSHVLETTAHEQIAKINEIFAEHGEKPPFRIVQKSVIETIEESRKQTKNEEKVKKPPKKSKDLSDIQEWM